MARVVDGGVVQQQQVLVRAATTDVKAAVAFSRALDARQQLNRFQDVDFAHQGREALDGRDGDFGFAEVGAFCVLARGSHNGGRAHHDRLGCQFHVPLHVAGSVQFL